MNQDKVFLADSISANIFTNNMICTINKKTRLNFRDQIEVSNIRLLIIRKQEVSKQQVYGATYSAAL